MMETLIGMHALRGDVLVDIYDDGEDSVELAPGRKFILLNDTQFARDRDGSETHSGIRPRWARVLATSDYAESTGIRVGMKVLCDTMKWFRGVQYNNIGQKLWRIPANDIIGIDDDGLTEDEMSKIKDTAA